MMFATGGAIFKNLINLLYLAASSMRIVSLDVDQKNNPKVAEDKSKVK